MTGLPLLLVQLLTVIVTGRVLARVLRPFGQPAVIAEILAGIALGPSLLGSVSPALSAALFPPTSMPGLSLVSQFALVLFMFLVGLEFDPRLLRGRVRSSLFVSQSSIVVPFLSGAGLAAVLFPRFGLPACRWCRSPCSSAPP